MIVRPALAVVVSLAAALTAACGSGGGSGTTTTLAPASTTTLPKPIASIEVKPAQGQIGTSFVLIGTGFKPGETVTFDIVFPDNRPPFKGQPHKTTPDGALQTTYRATAGNPAGTYKVEATGDMGTNGEASFVLGTATAPGSTTATTTAARATTSTG